MWAQYQESSLFVKYIFKHSAMSLTNIFPSSINVISLKGFLFVSNGFTVFEYFLPLSIDFS